MIIENFEIKTYILRYTLKFGYLFVLTGCTYRLIEGADNGEITKRVNIGGKGKSTRRFGSQDQ